MRPWNVPASRWFQSTPEVGARVYIAKVPALERHEARRNGGDQIAHCRTPGPAQAQTFAQKREAVVERGKRFDAAAMLGDDGFVAGLPGCGQAFEYAGIELRLIRRDGKDTLGRDERRSGEERVQRTARSPAVDQQRRAQCRVGSRREASLAGDINRPAAKGQSRKDSHDHWLTLDVMLEFSWKARRGAAGQEQDRIRHGAAHTSWRNT